MQDRYGRIQKQTEFKLEKNIYMENPLENAGTKEFHGLAVNSGKVFGPTCLYSSEHQRPINDFRLSESEVASELDIFEKALKECTSELEDGAVSVASKVGNAEAEIFLTQKHIMNDITILEMIRSAITLEKKNAQYAISEAFDDYEKKFLALDNPYLRERATDIREIRRRLLDNIRKTSHVFVCEGQQNCERGKNRIIVAEELTVEMMARMNFEKVSGLVTEHGGVSSHAAIIARSLGIPAVSGVHDIMQHVRCGDTILIDGDLGKVYINPSTELTASTMPKETTSGAASVLLSSPRGLEIQANASGMDDVFMARDVNADGIGLYRTEILFLKADRLLNEDEQFAEYSRVTEALPGKTITFRLVDAGGDKALPFMRIKKENNPYLGWRGARFLLGNPDILAAQIRAIIRLSDKNSVRILFPMVVDAAQQDLLIKAVKESIVTAKGKAENIKLGVMFEVPSACIQAREIYKNIDFGSIGTNDLIQYLFAVDRTNEQVSDGYNPDHPVLWNVLKGLVNAAHEAKKGLSVCGEMAGREGMAMRLVDIGIRSLSVSARLIPQVRLEVSNFKSGKYF
jgi:phosphotransferase system enzyme I (PtsI)